MDSHSVAESRAHNWTESGGGLFEPDVILPSQFFLKLRGRASDGGERRLIVAVLEDAVCCYQKHLFSRDNKGRRLFREAEAWMMSGDKEAPYSFENICEFLSLNPDHLRQGLRRWARNAAAARSEISEPSTRPMVVRSGASRDATAPSRTAMIQRVAAA